MVSLRMPERLDALGGPSPAAVGAESREYA
jgi:hypothetical protein